MANDTLDTNEMPKDRYLELKKILEGRRREILSEVHEKMRDVRIEVTSVHVDGDDGGLRCVQFQQLLHPLQQVGSIDEVYACHGGYSLMSDSRWKL